MKNMGIQLDLFDANEELDGKLYELYEKTPNREFKNHVQFIVADSLKDAEDKATIVDTEYWRTKSVRPVGVSYAWDTFEKIHFSYRMCKSILGLEGTIED